MTQEEIIEICDLIEAQMQDGDGWSSIHEKIGGGSRIQALLKALEEKDAVVRVFAIKAIVLLVRAMSRIKGTQDLYDKIVAILTKALQNDEDARVRIAAAIAVGEFYDRPFGELLIKALEDGERQVREVAAIGLGDLCERKAVPRLIESLKDDDLGYDGHVVRTAAAGALERIGDQRAVPALRSAMKDADSQMKGVFAHSLSRLTCGGDGVFSYCPSLNPSSKPVQSQFTGAMLGGALGDALGAPYEGGGLERLAWKVICAASGEGLRWTDDTQMTLVLARSLVEDAGVDADKLALRWAKAAEWSRGYGPGATKLLKAIAKGDHWKSANKRYFPDGSFGNGGAMRVGPIGLFYHGDLEALKTASESATRITHANPRGVEGALLIARATVLAMDTTVSPEQLLEFLRVGSFYEDFRKRLARAGEFLVKPPKAGRVREDLGNSVRALESVVSAIYIFCRFPNDFQEMMAFAVELGGDVDTIGAMAGTLFGARNGESALPKEQISRLEAQDEIAEAARELYTKASAR